MSSKNAKIYLCAGIRMDRGYNNVLSYTETQMVTLCQSKAIASANNYSFIRQEKNAINTSFTYNQCLSANYIAFQNTSLSNKWFFAWIDEVEYISDAVTKIKFKVDAWSTWYEKFPKQACMVKREHVSTDTYGANRQPEPIAGSRDYINYNYKTYNLAPNGYGVKITATGPYDSGDTYGSKNGMTWIGLYRLKLISTLSQLGKTIGRTIKHYNENKYGQNIIDMQLYPSCLDGIAADNRDSNKSTTFSDTFTLGRSGNNYKNAKTLQYPYCKITASNGTSETDFMWEDFTYSDATYQIRGQLWPATEIKLIPVQYKGRTFDLTSAIDSPDYPTIPYSLNSWESWYAINGSYTNMQMIGQAVGAIGTIGINAVTGDVEKIVSTGVSEELNLLQTNQNLKQKRAAADTTHGSLAKGNVQFLVNNGFTLFERRLPDDELKAIDDYFTRFGYAINKIKVPNYTGRRYWNFVQLGDVIANGSVPTNYMEKINNALLTGVTIWHSHDNIGNFALNNDI